MSGSAFGLAVGEVGVNRRSHSAAFIWKPSSILSEGATG